MRRLGILPMFALAMCTSATDLDVDLGAFERLPSVDELDFTRIVPAREWDYWELRFSLGDGDIDNIVGSGGALSRTDLPAPVLSELDALAPPTGFARGCLPGHCFKFIAAVRGDRVFSFTRTDTLLEFLGGIGTSEEAILLVDAHGFNWQPADDDTGYRALDAGGWEFVVLDLVRDCAPIQIDRVLLRVSPEGTLSERARELWEKEDEMCI
ncbi:MAG: hypothetical protein ACRELV_05350 [Longimicrobiales bacterium]